MPNLSVLISSNRFLQAIPAEEFNELKGYLERINLWRGESVYSSGEFIKYIYFPENCLVTMMTTFDDGTAIESGLIGFEGIVGAYCALSANNSSNREAVVRISGQAVRMKAEDFRNCLKELKIFNQLVQKYIFIFTEQVAQIGACNSKHNLSERLPRLLLMIDDRTQSNQIAITQESVAEILGVHRPNVTCKLILFKQEEIIDYYRGKLIIKKREKLEAQTCQCYKVMQEIYSHYRSINVNPIPAIKFKPNVRVIAGKQPNRLPLNIA